MRASSSAGSALTPTPLAEGEGLCSIAIDVPEESHRIKHALTPPLALRDVTVAYRRKPVLWDIDYEAHPQSLVGIVGPNGAGKSTLIKAVLGLVPLSSGEVSIFGKSAHTQRKRVGYVPQRESVDWDFPASALDVVVMGRYGKIGWFRRITKSHKQAAMECLAQVGMADLAHRQIGQLSGGQQQRVFLARALAQEADLYLMDEPFAGVDAATERAIVEILRTLRAQGKTCIVVHHDLHTVSEYFDHLMLLNMRIIAAGETNGVFTHENLRKTYGGRLTLLEKAATAVARGEVE